jgi:hypothetical protein
MKIDPVSKTLCSQVLEYQMMDQAQNPVIMNDIQHPQHLLESASIV